MIKRNINQCGAAMIIVVLFFIIISATLLIGISNPIANQIRGTNEFLFSKSSYNVANSQIENALYRFNKGKNDAPTDITVLGASAKAILTDIGDVKSLVVEGGKNFFNRYIKAEFKIDTGTSFNYGMQTGEGGLQMSGSSHIIGNVYANGDIIGNGGPGWATTYITGSAISATLSNPTESVIVSSSTAAGSIFPFGLINSNQDIAQSFVTSTTTPINEIIFYIKKTGLPANSVVKIVNDNLGSPGSTVITSGTLNSSTITTSFSYVPVVMTSAVNLTLNSTYWIVVDNSSNNSSNYYSLLTYDNIYPSGKTKQGRFVNSMTSLSTTTLDFDFKILVGGNKGVISGVRVGTIGNGDAWANTVTNTISSGNIYCQNGSGNSKTCDSSRSDPVSTPYPISQANIDEWKGQAVLGGSTTTVNVGDDSVVVLGPIKINGNLVIGGSGNLYLTGPVYVTGDVVFEGNSRTYVDSSMGATSVNIIADGSIKVGGSARIFGSGQSGSYVVLNSLKSCTDVSNCSSNPSIIIEGDSGAIVLNTLNGAVKLSGSAAIKAVVAKMILMEGNTSVNYESGLADMNFTSGPSGSWTVKSWKEVLGF